MAAGDSGMGDAFAVHISNTIFESTVGFESISNFPVIVWIVKLCTTAPKGDTAGTEVTAGGYSATDVGNNWALAGQTTDNDANIDFGTLTANVTVNGIEIWAVTPTNSEQVERMLWIEIAPIAFTSGEIPRIPAGDLNITFA